ncbi:MAG: glycosyltransferase [Kiritimatiellae bacterium]|nr:glycosyltransferase [Kiritimatiellia bacterium]
MSILITAYKNANLVKRCVDSLRESFGGKLPETVIVDDAAGDAEIAALAASYADDGVKFAVMPRNGGFAGANNFGWPLCTKEFPVLVNSDIVFHEEPFTAMLDFMDSHPRAGIVQGTLIIKNGQEGVDGTLNGCGAFLTPFGTTTTPGWLAPADDPVAKRARKCFAAYGAMFMVRRSVVESTGRLFYDFFHTYYEEVDFCHRAWLVGWEVWYVPTPPVDHAHGATMSKFYTREDVLRKFYRNMRFSFATCFGTRGRLMIRPLFELGCFVQSLLQLIKGSGMAWRTHRWARRELKNLKQMIAEARQNVQSMRVVSDTKLFKIICKRYALRELWQVIRQNT